MQLFAYCLRDELVSLFKNLLRDVVVGIGEYGAGFIYQVLKALFAPQLMISAVHTGVMPLRAVP